MKEEIIIAILKYFFMKYEYPSLYDDMLVIKNHLEGWEEKVEIYSKQIKELLK